MPPEGAAPDLFAVQGVSVEENFAEVCNHDVNRAPCSLHVQLFLSSPSEDPQAAVCQPMGDQALTRHVVRQLHPFFFFFSSPFPFWETEGTAQCCCYGGGSLRTYTILAVNQFRL